MEILKLALEYIGDACILSFGIWSLFTFVMIIKKGKAVFIEPNKKILYTEAVIAGLAIVLGVERVIEDLIGW